MPTPARDRLALLLAGTEPARSDSATLRLPGDALELEVAALGPIQTPIRAPQAKRLIGAARPAHFGRGEETLSDASVRDTWELTPDQVHLGGSSWQASLDAALEHFSDELGLPSGSRLTAELHSMLVYGKGQFFLPHQDSEKHDEMVASLVVMLPSVHTGGELVIDDGGHERVYRGSRDDIVLVAFYADRRHEVRPVRSGHRVTLTFNLLLTRPNAASAPGPIAQAASYLTDHFSTRAVRPYGGRDLGAPTRLAFLLDHEYTQKGLAAGRFKGADAERVAMLRAAAERAGCESVFALAEIKETWDAESADHFRHDWYDDESDESDELDRDEGDAFDLNSLIDSEITLGWWVRPDGAGRETVSLPLTDHEVCTATPTKSLTPYETEYEGFMGNYGNTLDRWYRRAAVVVWPTERAFAARAEAGSAWALQTLLDRIDDGDLEGARADAASLEPFWHHVEPALLVPALQVAVGLGEPAIARVVAAPFRLEVVSADHAPLLAAAAREYGDAWLMDLVGSWESSTRFGSADRLTWVTDALVPVCHALRDHGAEPIAAACAALVWRRLSGQVAMWVAQDHPEQRRVNLTELGAPTASVLEAASDELGATIAQVLRDSDDNAIELLVSVLRAHQPSARGAVATPALAAIADDCRSRLTRHLEAPARTEDDWSIAWTGCGCDLCKRLAEFLGARDERSHEWPLATPGRQHVHQKIDAAGLPVRHTTRRQGRPYTLLLAKTEALFRREDDSRQQARTDLDWLTAEFEGAASSSTHRGSRRSVP